MLNTVDFIKCIRDGLTERGFKKARIDEITGDFRSRVEAHTETGMNPTDASVLAMRETFDNLTREAQEKAKRTAKMLSVQAENNRRIAEALKVDVKAFTLEDAKGKQVAPRGSRGAAIGRAAVAFLEDDPRFTGMSYSGTKEVVRGQLYALFGDVLNKISKGAFGRQKGKAHLPNIIREIKGDRTGDATAREFAQAWLKVQDLAVDMFNQAGGSMRKIPNYLPQGMNVVKMTLAKEARWVEVHMKALDWDATTWPNGKKIKPEERQSVLSEVYKTLTQDGANKIDTAAFRGRGRAVGNMLDNNRFLHYKDAQSWLDVHEEFGDGNVFDILTRHMEQMAHRIALVETFGPNPEMTALNVNAMVRKQSAQLGAKEQANAQAVMKNKFEPMFETIMRDNPMDPHSTLGNVVTGVSNILTAAQLGSASFLAIPGDFMQTAAVRALNNMGMFDGIGFYVKSLASDPQFMREISAQSGFVMDEVVMATYSQTRWTGLATYGPAITSRISEAVMRASLLSGHTRSARWAVQAEFMGMLNRMKSTEFQDLPFRHVMERYGITPDEWNALRNNVRAWTPRKDISFMRPIDILKTDVPNRQALYNKFQGMIFEESRKMVPESTIEGAVTLKDTTRPDTLVGALLYSFAMYKNFPVSFTMIYGRLGMTSPRVRGRLAFYAGLGAGMTMVGALGTQLREVSKGRDPLPMDNAAFFGKAMLSGGALSIYGDFLFTGINEFGRGPQDVVAGPLVGFLGDTTDLVLGDVFQWANAVGTLSDGDVESKLPAKSVEWLKRYTPGTSIWWARLALERQMWDRLQEIADPQAYRKRRSKMRKRQREYDQGYWWAPGQRTPERAPQFGD